MAIDYECKDNLNLYSTKFFFRFITAILKFNKAYNPFGYSKTAYYIKIIFS